MKNITRFELIDNTGRVIVHRNNEPFTIEIEEQDDYRTVKVFVGTELRDDECARLRARLVKAEAVAKVRGQIISRLERVLSRYVYREERREAYEQGRAAGYRQRANEEADT